MKKNISAKDRFAHLLKVISSKRFLARQGLGNEVPFFICAFPAEEAFAMSEDIGRLKSQLDLKGVKALEINLYDVAVAELQKREILEQVLEVEPTVSKGELKQLLQGVLDPAKHIIPVIADAIRNNPHDVILLTGVGEVFPYVRSHNILNNLQSTAKEKPTVMFFPGSYTHSPAGAASLDLFSRLHDDKYYRAFDILNYEV